MRDAKQIESTCNSQEAALLGTDLGSTAEEVLVQVKKHEAFEKLVQAQDDRLELLHEHGNKLVNISLPIICWVVDADLLWWTINSFDLELD